MNCLQLKSTTLIVIWLIATIINFLLKISLENYATTELEQNKYFNIHVLSS